MGDFSARERVRSFGYAGRGLRILVASQHNAWIHLALTGVAVGLGFGLGISRLEWCAIVVVIAMVWVAEALNTAIELLADAAVPEEHPKVGRAKDVAAGGVLVAAVAAAIVGLVVFAPKLLGLLC